MSLVDQRNALKSNLLGAALALGFACSSCQMSSPAPLKIAVDPALAGYVLSDVPSDLPNRCYLDFGGKVALVGYAIDPVGVISPGRRVKLTLYWQSLSPLGPGWGLFTHLIVPHQPHRVLDSAGPLRKLVPAEGGGQRQALGPSAWERGKVYVDPLEFEIPLTALVPELTIAVGVWRDAPRVIIEGKAEDPKLSLPGLRLPVLSGPADDMQRGIVLHIDTGLPLQFAQMAPVPQLGKMRGTSDVHGKH